VVEELGNRRKVVSSGRFRESADLSKVDAVLSQQHLFAARWKRRR
jgi:hypothetical protein